MTPSPDIPEREIRERCATLLAASAEEARRLNHNYIGTEHLFMAVIQNENGPTATLLKRAGMNPRHVYNEIRREAGKLEGPLLDEVLPLTPRSEIVLYWRSSWPSGPSGRTGRGGRSRTSTVRRIGPARGRPRGSGPAPFPASRRPGSSAFSYPSPGPGSSSRSSGSEGP